MSCVRRDYEIPPCWGQAIPSGSKTEPPLAKAGPTSNADVTFLITYLRKGKKHCAVAVQENEKT